MKKQKLIYHFYRYDGNMLLAKKETPFEIKLKARLVLDTLCYKWNKKQLQQELNDAIDRGDEQEFKLLSEAYRSYIWD